MTAKPEEMLWFESTISENVEPEVSFVEQEKEEVLVSCTWYLFGEITIAYFPIKTYLCG